MYRISCKNQHNYSALYCSLNTSLLLGAESAEDELCEFRAVPAVYGAPDAADELAEAAVDAAVLFVAVPAEQHVLAFFSFLMI